MKKRRVQYLKLAAPSAWPQVWSSQVDSHDDSARPEPGSHTPAGAWRVAGNKLTNTTTCHSGAKACDATAISRRATLQSEAVDWRPAPTLPALAGRDGTPALAAAMLRATTACSV